MDPENKFYVYKKLYFLFDYKEVNKIECLIRHFLLVLSLTHLMGILSRLKMVYESKPCGIQRNTKVSV